MMGLLTDSLRMPLMPLEDQHRARLRTILEEAGLLGTAESSAPTRRLTTAGAHA
jgi:hypothetical protein